MCILLTQQWADPKTDGIYSLAKHPDDIVITTAIRTPLTKGFKGGLKDTSLDELMYNVFKVRRSLPPTKALKACPLKTRFC